MFNFSRRKTEKWGHILLFTAYLILFLNVFALAMTIMNMVGYMNSQNPFFDDADRSHKRESAYLAEIYNRTDISEEEKFSLIAEEQMDE